MVIKTRTSKYGYFCDPEGRRIWPGHSIVDARWCNDGTRDMVLLQPVRYVAPDGTLYTVPAGYRTNGLSAPKMSWIICSPFEPRSREAAVLHDWLCDAEGGNMDWLPAADMFYDAMISNAMLPVKAGNRWAAVRYVGRWFQWRHR
jgi:Protein of unknown function (DUF1353)